MLGLPALATRLQLLLVLLSLDINLLAAPGRWSSSLGRKVNLLISGVQRWLLWAHLEVLMAKAALKRRGASRRKNEGRQQEAHQMLQAEIMTR